MNANLLKAAALAALFALAPVQGRAQSSSTFYTNPAPTAQTAKEAAKWLRKGEWREGFTGASPDATVNAVEFYTQYKKNPGQWKALFRWLAQTDLLALPKGKTPIPGCTLVASVEDDTNRDLDKQRSESHYRHIDFQFVVKGTERFALLDHYTSKPNTKYRPDVIHYEYDLEKTKFVDSRPDRFFLFFPCDWHIAKLKTDKADQSIRVVVVKLDYIE